MVSIVYKSWTEFEYSYTETPCFKILTIYPSKDKRLMAGCLYATIVNAEEYLKLGDLLSEFQYMYVSYRKPKDDIFIYDRSDLECLHNTLMSNYLMFELIYNQAFGDLDYNERKKVWNNLGIKEVVI